MSTPLHLVLLAGGKGLRAGGADGVPKQFRSTGRGALFAVSLRHFLAGPSSPAWRLASVTVTAADTWRTAVDAELSDLDLPRLVAPPGATRTASTHSALETLQAARLPASDDLVAVHDTARPFATASLLDALARAALDHGGAVPGVPVADTIIRTGDGGARYLRREVLQAVQTPQVFRWAPFRAAHAWAAAEGRDFTDDGGLMAERGAAPAVVPGETGNWKVTTAEDWERALAELDG